MSRYEKPIAEQLQAVRKRIHVIRRILNQADQIRLKSVPSGPNKRPKKRDDDEFGTRKRFERVQRFDADDDDFDVDIDLNLMKKPHRRHHGKSEKRVRREKHSRNHQKRNNRRLEKVDNVEPVVKPIKTTVYPTQKETKPRNLEDYNQNKKRQLATITCQKKPYNKKKYYYSDSNSDSDELLSFSGDYSFSSSSDSFDDNYYHAKDIQFNFETSSSEEKPQKRIFGTKGKRDDYCKCDDLSESDYSSSCICCPRCHKKITKSYINESMIHKSPQRNNHKETKYNKYDRVKIPNSTKNRFIDSSSDSDDFYQDRYEVMSYKPYKAQRHHPSKKDKYPVYQKRHKYQYVDEDDYSSYSTNTSTLIRRYGSSDSDSSFLSSSSSDLSSFSDDSLDVDELLSSSDSSSIDLSFLSSLTPSISANSHSTSSKKAKKDAPKKSADQPRKKLSSNKMDDSIDSSCSILSSLVDEMSEQERRLIKPSKDSSKKPNKDKKSKSSKSSEAPEEEQENELQKDGSKISPLKDKQENELQKDSSKLSPSEEEEVKKILENNNDNISSEEESNFLSPDKSSSLLDNKDQEEKARLTKSEINEEESALSPIKSNNIQDDGSFKLSASSSSHKSEEESTIQNTTEEEEIVSKKSLTTTIEEESFNSKSRSKKPSSEVENQYSKSSSSHKNSEEESSFNKPQIELNIEEEEESVSTVQDNSPSQIEELQKSKSHSSSNANINSGSIEEDIQDLNKIEHSEEESINIYVPNDFEEEEESALLINHQEEEDDDDFNDLAALHKDKGDAQIVEFSNQEPHKEEEENSATKQGDHLSDFAESASDSPGVFNDDDFISDNNEEVHSDANNQSNTYQNDQKETFPQDDNSNLNILNDKSEEEEEEDFEKLMSHFNQVIENCNNFEEEEQEAEETDQN